MDLTQTFVKTQLNQLVKASLFAGLSALTQIIYLQIVPVNIVNYLNIQLVSVFLFLGATQINLTFSFLMGITADLIIGFSNPHGYLPLYMFATIFWAIIPQAIINPKKCSFLQIILSVFICYILATFANSFASSYYFHIPVTISIIPRIISIIVFAPILSFVLYTTLKTSKVVTFNEKRKQK